MLKYEAIATDLKQRIVNENLQQGDKLPNLNELCRLYDVSKSTVVKALSQLEQQCIIYQVHGSGIFVRKPKRVGYLNIMENQGYTQLTDKLKITHRLLDLQVVKADEWVSHHLHCLVGEEVYLVKRLQFLEDQPLSIEETYYRKSLVPYLNRAIVEDSIFKYLQEALNLTISFSDKFLKVDKLIEEEAELLELNVGDPVLHIEEIYYLSSGEPVNCSRLSFHYVNSQFFIQSTGIN